MQLAALLNVTLQKLNLWIVATLIVGVVAYAWAERDHGVLRAQLDAKVDTSAVQLLRRDITEVKASVDSMNGRLRDFFCDQKPRYCR